MKISELFEDTTAASIAGSIGSVGGLVTRSGNIATVANPHVTNPYLGKKPKHTKPKKVRPTDNALDMDVSLFGGSKIKR